jgi:hypothetical protein
MENHRSARVLHGKTEIHQKVIYFLQAVCYNEKTLWIFMPAALF